MSAIQVVIDERRFLEKLKSDLKLPDDITKDIYNESAKVLLEKFISDAVSDERLSPEEQSEYDAICKSLNVDLKFEKQTQAALDRFKLYWQLENGDLPTLNG